MEIRFYIAKILKKLRGSAIKNSSIHHSSKIEAGSHVINAVMSKHSFCGYDCELLDCDIGSFVSIANQVSIGSGMHPLEWVSMSPVFYSGRDSVKAKFSTHEREPVKRTTIGHDVWIGQKSLIKQGITIGTGAVIGMGSVVTKNVPPYAIVGGSPAKIIRMRFDETTIQKLLDSKWWDFDDATLHKYAQYFTSPDDFFKAKKL